MKNTIVTTLTFGHDGDAQSAQLHGWSSAGGQGFTPTVGTESALVLPRPEAPFGFFIELRLHAFLNNEGAAGQRMLLRLDDRPIGNVTLQRPAVFAFFVSGPSTAGGQMNLTIEHPDAARPGKDRRERSLAFHRLRIMRLDEPLTDAKPRMAAMPFPPGDPIANVQSLLGISARDLVMSFETLAGHCHFGLLQRVCGAEPLNLLRFAGARVMTSIDGLDNAFAGIGEEITPRLTVRGHQWMIDDRKYNLSYHTFLSPTKVTAEGIIEQEQRRVRFLHRKFLEDLRAAPKIFVCAGRLGVVREEALALFLALGRQSPAWMLWVDDAPDRERAGIVEHLLPGLLRGTMDRSAEADEGSHIPIAGWLTLLANAWALRLAATD